MSTDHDRNRLICDIITDARVRVHRWSQAEAAERLGLGTEAYRRREVGEVHWSAAELLRVSAVFGLPIERLHGLEPVCLECGSRAIVMRSAVPVAPKGTST